MISFSQHFRYHRRRANIRYARELHMDTASKFITPGIIFLLTLASGVWLSNSGKPLNTVLFNFHKLIALATVIITAIQIFEILKNTEIQVLLITLIIFTGLCVLALFISGALLGLGKPVNNILIAIHKVAPFLAAISMAITIYLLACRKHGI